MDLKIKPTSLKGNILLPPSKSISHRAVICAALAKGRSIISNLLVADDLTATIGALKALGANISDVSEGTVAIEGVDKNPSGDRTIDCNESGSTLRFLLPLALNGNKNIFTGRGRLVERPQKIYRDIFKNQNIYYKSLSSQELPLEIKGYLKPDNFSFPGNISSQFISGLLFALPLLKGNSKITLTENVESKGYIDLTLAMLEKFGIKIDVKDDYKKYYIRGNQEYKAQNVNIEGDYSQAAFWLVAGLLKNSLNIQGLSPDSLQGDRMILDIIKSMKGSFYWENENLIASESKLEGAVIDVADCPDLVPVLAVLATQSKGVTKIINAERLRIKESDRLFASASELAKLGADIKEAGDSLIIKGKTPLKGGIVSSHKDHRIAMALAVASIVCEEDVIIQDAEVVSKSYPSFWEDFVKIGGRISEC